MISVSRNIVSSIIITALILIASVCSVNKVFAANEELLGGTIVNQVERKEDISTQVPVGKYVTIDDAENYVKDRGGRLVVFFQNIAKPISILVMVICGFRAILSALVGNSKDGGPGKWIFGGFLAALCYVAILWAPVLLEITNNFFSIN